MALNIDDSREKTVMQDEFTSAILRTIAFHEQEIKRLRRLLSNSTSYAVKLSNKLDEMHITQTELAKSCGVSQWAISRYCNSDVIPDEVMQQKINAAIGWSKTIENALKGGPADPNEATFF